MSTPTLPEHVSLSIEHNEHRLHYETIEQYLARPEEMLPDIEPEDRAEILRTGELWVVKWYPNSPVGHCDVAAATLDRALALAAAWPKALGAP